MNAQWMVKFQISSSEIGERQEAVYLASPDLKNTREAKKRATKTARERLQKKLRKDFDRLALNITVRHLETVCVG